MDCEKVERCVDALREDHARQSGVLTAEDAARVIDRRDLSANEAAEVWHRVERLGLVTVAPEATADLGGTLAREGSNADAEVEGGRDLDLLHLFIGDIRRVPRLSDAEIVQLAHLIRVGNQVEDAVRTGTAREANVASAIEAGRRAHDRFVAANIRLVIYFAKDYLAMPGASKLDIIQDGILGLMRAVDRFEPARGYRFATYAVWWIRNYIVAGLATQGSVITLPAKVSSMLARMVRGRHRFTLENGRPPTLKELAADLEIEPGTIRFLQQLETMPLSLDAPSAGTDELTFGDGICDRSSPDPEQQLARAEIVAAIQKNLEGLSDRDRTIVLRRFGFDAREEATLQELADEFGLSRERIRQIIASAVGRFKHAQAWKVLR